MRVIAIDGPAGSGKSTVARRVAEKLGLDYLDTGAMYRAVAFAALRRGVDPEEWEPVAKLAEELDIVVDDTVTEGAAQNPGWLLAGHAAKRRAHARPELRCLSGGADDVPQHRADPDRGELVRVADQHQVRVITYCLNQAHHQRERHHRGLIHDHEVVRQAAGRVVAVAPTRQPAEQPVDR